MSRQQSDTQYMLFSKQPTTPRPQQHYTLSEFRNCRIYANFEAGPCSVDFEANTNKPESPDLYIRTAALANDDMVVGVDTLNCTDADWMWFMSWLCRQQLVVYNSLYDHYLLYQKTGKLVTPHADCFIAFKMLGGKKYTDSNVGHGLKWVQTEIFGWAKGNDEIKEYMTANGLSWGDIKKFDRDILLRYNCLDADATWALYKTLQQLIQDNWDDWGQYFPDWHREDCLTEATLQIEAMSEGMRIDEGGLSAYRALCETNRDRYLQEFLEHPLLVEGVREFNKQYCESIWDNPPQQFKKDGTLTSNWLKRQAKYEEALTQNHFNTNSPKQLQWLLYEHAGIAPPKADMSTDAEALQQIGEVGQLLLSYRAMVTELKFVTQVAENKIGSRFHPSVIFPATMTGRCASGQEVE